MEDEESEFLALARNGDVENLSKLRSEHQDLNINCKGKAKSNRGWTALHLASYFGHLQVVEYLLTIKVDTDVKNFAGDTPLHKAAFTSREDVVRKLIEHNANLFIQNDERKKASNVACDQHIKNVLQTAEKVQIRKLAHTLTNAAKEGDVDAIVDTLSAYPGIINANTQDEIGNTPLHYAAMRDNRSVAVYLLHHGGDSSIANKNGNTAMDLCKTQQLRSLLDVQPIQNSAKTVQRFEGFIYRKRLMRSRLHWVVLEQGVLSYFARHADAVTGSKRRMFKYLTDAVVTAKEENTHSFQISFFDDSVHYLQVRKCPEAQISRQKWVQAILLHIDYSSHYSRVGKLRESDSEDDNEDVLPVVDIQNTLETGFAHHELLKKQVDEFAVSVHKLAVSDTSQTAQMLLGKCHQILNISNEMSLAFTACLTTLQHQDQVRKIQLSQEKEKTRVWQQAFEALATEHHHLERTLSCHSPASLASMSLSSNPQDGLKDVNGFARPGTAESGGSEVLSDEDQFFDAFDSEDEPEGEFASSPHQAAAPTHQLNDNIKTANNSMMPQANGRVEKTIHYEHKHTETHMRKGRVDSYVTDDLESVDESTKNAQGDTTKTIHVEKKFHSEKEVRRKDIQAIEREESSVSSMSDSASHQFQDCEEFIHRKKLPVVMISRDNFSFWSILKQCIGKELSKITFPVIFNEPLCFHQRLCEYMEYTHLLKKASTVSDPTKRLEYVAAFSVSALASQLGRVGKPYNPLLGETFEFNRPDLGFTWVSEQVSHHPPVSAFHATGTNSEFEFHGSVHPKLKFWGKSVEVEPKGVMTVTLNGHNESYTWSNPHCSVQNVVVGKPWIEQHGIAEITNHSTGEKCVINFKSHSWFRNDLNKVEAYIMDSKKKKLRYMEGDWTKHLYSLSPEAYEKYKRETNPQHHKSGKEKKGSSSSKTSAGEVIAALEADKDVDCYKIWGAEERPSFSHEYYSFTSFAMTLNEINDEEKNLLPPTDTRNRPDMRCQENGDIDGAGDEKWRLEEKQRAARKLRNKQKAEWNPRWFKHAKNPITDSLDWIFNPKYQDRDWSSCPDIF